MADYDVTKNKNLGKWQAKKEKANRVSGYYDTQAGAEKAAKKFSSGNGGGEVRIQDRHGKFRDSDTIPPGNDPNPPKDKKH